RRCVWHACNPGNRTRKKLAGHNSIYKGNKRLMRRLRVLSDLQSLPHVGRIGVHAASGKMAVTTIRQAFKSP
ncbi:hypothetical protein, partial [Escherichia coli]|uniref:hypothetical protein n=1 Tax=Escherichia coli TaxID=562 RepID=UPI002DB84501